MSKRCAIYIRVSTEEQFLNGLSLDAQKKALTDFASANNYTIVDVYADEGISARKAMKNRKELMRLLEDVKQNKIDMILVTKLDRWFRNIKDYNITEEILQAHGCHWKTIFENYDSSTANGQMVINIMLSVNQAECDRTSERIKAVFDYKRSIGEVTSGMCAPYGYIVENGKLVKDPETRDIVDAAFSHYFSCYSKKRVLKYIMEIYGDKSPSVYKIEGLFKNEKYAGMCKNRNDYCEPYITPDQFRMIQEISQSRTLKKNQHTYIFSSLLICPKCGKKMVGKCKTHTCKDGRITKSYRYICQERYNRHSSPCITEHIVEEFMIANIFKKLQNESVTLETKTRAQSSKKGIEKRILSEINRLNTMFQKGRITEEFYDSEYDRLNEELKKCDTSRTENLKKRYSELADYFSGDWLSLYRKLDNQHRQVFWKSMIHEIHFDPDTHKLSDFTFRV